MGKGNFRHQLRIMHDWLSKKGDVALPTNDLRDGTLQQFSRWIERPVRPTMLSGRGSRMHFARIDNHNTSGRRYMVASTIFKLLCAPLDDAYYITFMGVRRKSM